MKMSKNVKTLIDNFSKYMDQTTNMDDLIDEAEALKLITVVERSTNRFYWLTGFDLGISDEPIALRLRSIKPVYEYSDDFAGLSVEHAPRSVHDDCFDEEFLLYDDWVQGLENLTIAEIDYEIFKFLQPYLISWEPYDWSFEYHNGGKRISLQFYGHTDPYDRLVLKIESINSANIFLYNDKTMDSHGVLMYDKGSVSIDPVKYGPLSAADMTKLCDKVEEIMRRNGYER